MRNCNNNKSLQKYRNVFNVTTYNPTARISPIFILLTSSVWFVWLAQTHDRNIILFNFIPARCSQLHPQNQAKIAFWVDLEIYVEFYSENQPLRLASYAFAHEIRPISPNQPNFSRITVFPDNIMDSSFFSCCVSLTQRFKVLVNTSQDTNPPCTLLSRRKQKTV